MLVASLTENHSREYLCNLNATEVVQGNSKHPITSKPFLLQWIINMRNAIAFGI